MEFKAKQELKSQEKVLRFASNHVAFCMELLRNLRQFSAQSASKHTVICGILHDGIKNHGISYSLFHASKSP